jgi:hypothetical protein
MVGVEIICIVCVLYGDVQSTMGVVVLIINGINSPEHSPYIAKFTGGTSWLVYR